MKRSEIWLLALFRGLLPRAALIGSAVLFFALAGSERVAHASNTWDPTGERMAWTDRSTAADIQARVWLLTNGLPSENGRHLVSRRPDINQNGWYTTTLTGLDTGLDAVSWTEPTHQRQRVFYVKGAYVYMLPFDDDLAGAPSAINGLAAAQGYWPSNTDLAAVTFSVSGTRWIAVAAGGTLGGPSGNPGYLCIFESSDGGATWWNGCSSDRPLPSSNHDIVGVVDSSATPVPEFYFQNAFATLSRARRVGTNNWIFHEEVSVPTYVNPSLFAMPSQSAFPGQVSLGFIGSDNRVHTIRIAPTAFPSAASWLTQPALPGGAVPSTSKTALGGTPCCGTSGNEREKIYVIGSDPVTGVPGLYQTATYVGGSWNGWSGPYSSPSGLALSVGTVTEEASGSQYQARMFGAVGYPTVTLQEFSALSLKWKDYIKIQDYPRGVGDSGIAIAETGAVADTWLGIMTGTDRNYNSSDPTSPWLVRLRSSTDGGNSYDGTDSLIQPFGGSGWFLTDSTARIGGGLFHHSVLEIQYPPNGCHHTIGGLDNAIASKISYRHGTSAVAIAGLSTADRINGYIVDEANDPNLDHPWVVTTSDAAAHVVYLGDLTPLCPTGGICYWKLPSGGSPMRAQIDPLDARPPRAVKGPNDEVYAFGDDFGSWTKICTLKNAFAPAGVQDADCTLLGKGPNGPLVPAPSNPSGTLFGYGKIYVGPEVTQYPTPEMECQAQNNKLYKCFDAHALRAVAADPVTPYKVYVAYTASAYTSAPGIYFTGSPGGANWGVFTNPVLIAQDGANTFNYDPQVTVDTDGTIIVSYSTIATAPGDTSGAAFVQFKVSTDGGANWSGPYYPNSNGLWNTSLISYHCGRGTYFMGEYRDSDAFGNRAYLNFQVGGVGTLPYFYLTGWVNRWNLTN